MAATPSPLPPLVITGASGFVGRRLVQLARERAPDRQLVLLLRDPASLGAAEPLPPTWRVEAADLAADLAAGDMRAPLIPRGAVVLHLAAATGRLPAAVMRRVNVEGTRRLLEAARAGGASHLIFVSSTAAGFTDRRWYPYAEAKREGEALVRASGIPNTIVRPTMVFGEGSPVQQGLEQLAVGGAPIVLGRGDVQLQPVHVDDLAHFLLALALDPEPSDAPVDVGGATRASMRQVLAAMRAARALPARRLLSVPLAPLRPALALAERMLGPRLPVTAGQLASFVNDSVAAPHPLTARLLPAPRPLPAMLAASTTPASSSALAPTPMVAGAAADAAGELLAPAMLAREFEAFARYLGTTTPPEAGAMAYTRAAASAGTPGDRLDRWLLAMARGSTMGCSLADAYCRLARPYGVLRRRLVLALAVLESSSVTHAAYDSAIASRAATAWLAMGAAGMGWMLRTLVALLLIGPLHLAARVAGGGERSRG